MPPGLPSGQALVVNQWTPDQHAISEIRQQLEPLSLLPEGAEDDFVRQRAQALARRGFNPIHNPFY
eukprot:1547394-Pyramimonas_sp.AAC.1